MAEATDGVTKISCVLALLLFASVAVAQDTQAPVAPTAATEARVAAPQATVPTASAAPTSETTPAGSLKISYVSGQLRIDALDSTLRDVLTKVAALTGVKIEIPAGASSERLPVVKLGPGPARQILASLLSASSFDYLILASATDPDGIQNVILMPREKKGSGGNGGTGADPVAMARLARTPDPRVRVPPSRSDETPEPNSPAPAQPDNSAAQTTPAQPVQSASSPPTQPDQSAPSPPTQPDQSAPSPPTQPDQPALSRAALSNRSGLTSEGAMSPPSSMDPQSINQQLQQMYQQRMQMTQQNQPVPPPANSENK